jgi:hypothetical protein
MVDNEVGSPAQVFVPVGAPIREQTQAMPRILYVGKATRGFGEPDLGGFDDAASGSMKVIEDWLLPGGSAFWQFIRAVLQLSAEACGQPSNARLLEHFGWSNLAKIGDLDGNPDKWSLDIQKELCREALAVEIAAFAPTATILATTNYAQKQIVFPLFGEEDWCFDTPKKNRVAFKEHPQFGLLIWTNHPQGMRPAGTRAIVQEFVADLVKKHWRDEPLPECVWSASIRIGPSTIS